MSAFVSAIIVAAGGSTRMGSSDSKQFIALSGKTVIERTLTTFQHCGLIKEIVVVCREQDCERIREIADKNAFSKVSAVVKGGDSRAHSVKTEFQRQIRGLSTTRFTTERVRSSLSRRLTVLSKPLSTQARQPSELPLPTQSKS